MKRSSYFSTLFEGDWRWNRPTRLEPAEGRRYCQCFTAEAFANLGRYLRRNARGLRPPLIIDAPTRAEAGVQGEPLVVRGQLAKPAGPPAQAIKEFGGIKRLDATTYSEVVEALLKAAASYENRPAGQHELRTSMGWRLAANALRLFEGEGRADGRPANRYFVSLYRSLADAVGEWSRVSVRP